MAGTESTPKTAPDLKPYEDKIIATLQEADVKLASLETKAKAEREHATVAAIEKVKVARKKLEQELKSLSTVSAAQIQRAKGDIDAASTALKASLDELSRKFASTPTPAKPVTTASTAPAAPATTPAPTAKATSEKK